MKKIKELYEALIAHLDGKLKRQDNTTPLFTWHDLWYQQTDFPELAEAIEYPAVFYEFASDSVQLAGMDSKTVDLVASLFVCTNNYQDTHSNSIERTEALAFLDTLGKVDGALHGQAIGGIASFRLAGFAPYDNRTNMLVYRIDYMVTYLDDNALTQNHQTETVTVDAELHIEKRSPIPVTVPGGFGYDI